MKEITGNTGLTTMKFKIKGAFFEMIEKAELLSSYDVFIKYQLQS